MRKLNSATAAQTDEIFGRESQMSAKTHLPSPSEKAVFFLFFFFGMKRSQGWQDCAEESENTTEKGEKNKVVRMEERKGGSR